MSQNNGHTSTSLRLKTGLAEMLKGGVIMDVTTAKQAEIAERAGAGRRPTTFQMAWLRVVLVRHVTERKLTADGRRRVWFPPSPPSYDHVTRVFA